MLDAQQPGEQRWGHLVLRDDVVDDDRQTNLVGDRLVVGEVAVVVRDQDVIERRSDHEGVGAGVSGCLACADCVPRGGPDDTGDDRDLGVVLFGHDRDHRGEFVIGQGGAFAGAAAGADAVHAGVE